MNGLDLHQVRHQLGGTVYDAGRRWVGPGPGHSRKDASLSVWINDQGRPVVHSFAGDPFAACAAHLGLERSNAEHMDRRAYDEMRRQREAALRRRDAEDADFCESIWRGTVPIEGTPAEAYLWSRGLILEGATEIRFHPAAPRSKPKPEPERQPPPLPAMVALVRDVHGRPRALHTTSLLPDGTGKADVSRPRLMFGRVGGCAVRLDPLLSEGVLAIAEGIETAASFAALKGVPAWAALSAGGIANLELPAGLKLLLIAPDNDDRGESLAAAHKLAERARKHCAVEVRPAPVGRDWNDSLKGGR